MLIHRPVPAGSLAAPTSQTSLAATRRSARRRTQKILRLDILELHNTKSARALVAQVSCCIVTSTRQLFLLERPVPSLMQSRCLLSSQMQLERNKRQVMIFSLRSRELGSGHATRRTVPCCHTKYLNRRSLARSFKIARSFEMLPPAWQPTSSYQLPAELHRLVERAQTMRNIERTQFHGISFIATIRCFLYRICRCLELTPACALSYEKAQASECCFYCFWKPSNEQIGSSDWCWRSRQNCYTAASSDSLYHCTMI